VKGRSARTLLSARSPTVCELFGTTRLADRLRGGLSFQGSFPADFLYAAADVSPRSKLQRLRVLWSRQAPDANARTSCFAIASLVAALPLQRQNNLRPPRTNQTRHRPPSPSDILGKKSRERRTYHSSGKTGAAHCLTPRNSSLTDVPHAAPLQRQNSLGPPPTTQTVHGTVAPADTRQEAKRPLLTARPRPRSLEPRSLKHRSLKHCALRPRELKPSAMRPSALELSGLRLSALRLSALLLFIELQRSASGVFDYGPCRGIAPGASSLRLLDAR
jgi:hypothetical protein